MDQSEKEKADLCPLLFKHRGGCVNYDHCAETKATRDDTDNLAPVLWEPGDGEGHGDDGDDGEGRVTNDVD